MEALLRKFLWAVDLVVVTLCAIFLARAAASAVESSIVIPAPRANTRIARATTPTSYAKDYQDVIKRNVFCSPCPPIVEKPPEGTTTEVVDQTPQKTALPLAVLMIGYLPPPQGFRYSFAVIRDTEEKVTGPYSVGGKVRETTITEILETRIYLDNAGKTEYIDLFDPAASPANPAVSSYTPPPTAPTTAAADPLSQELDRGIRKTGEHTYDIQRATLESVLGNMNLLSRSARIVPEIRDGKNAGFRLYSVRPDGPFAKIGMQNGDVITSINGLEISSPEKALEVYSKLKSASHLSVGLERNGQKVTKDYSIR